MRTHAPRNQTADPCVDAVQAELLPKGLFQRTALQGRQVCQTFDAGQRGGVARANEQPAVLGFIGAVQWAGTAAIAADRFVPHLAVIQLHEGRLQRHGRIGQRRVHMLPFARALPVQQGERHGIGAHEAGAEIVYRVRLQPRLRATVPQLHARAGLRKQLMPGA